MTPPAVQSLSPDRSHKPKSCHWMPDFNQSFSLVYFTCAGGHVTLYLTFRYWSQLLLKVSGNWTPWSLTGRLNCPDTAKGTAYHMEMPHAKQCQNRAVAERTSEWDCGESQLAASRCLVTVFRMLKPALETGSSQEYLYANPRKV